MTATDELRRLLDERGVEYYGGTESTLWGYEQTSDDTGIFRYTADETSDGFVNVWMHHLTPSQAIDATLGRGTCHIDLVGYDEREDRFQCRSCDWSMSVRRGTWPRFNYCPNCGRRVVE